ncbi:MAG: hypothetical protein L3J68_00155 [Thermoplasmata archaeon]|nr:hypothetical protein [Thermoplasmata archaeon]
MRGSGLITATCVIGGGGTLFVGSLFLLVVPPSSPAAIWFVLAVGIGSVASTAGLFFLARKLFGASSQTDSDTFAANGDPLAVVEVRGLYRQGAGSHHCVFAWWLRPPTLFIDPGIRSSFPAYYGYEVWRANVELSILRRRRTSHRWTLNPLFEFFGLHMGFAFVYFLVKKRGSSRVMPETPEAGMLPAQE